MVENIRDDLQSIGVAFDNWFSERSLFQNREYERAMDLLRSKNYLSDRENAVWFNSSALGDEKDNVVVRSSGEPTYFASTSPTITTSFPAASSTTSSTFGAPTTRAMFPA